MPEFHTRSPASVISGFVTASLKLRTSATRELRRALVMLTGMALYSTSGSRRVRLHLDRHGRSEGAFPVIWQHSAAQRCLVENPGIRLTVVEIATFRPATQ